MRLAREVVEVPLAVHQSSGQRPCSFSAFTTSPTAASMQADGQVVQKRISTWTLCSPSPRTRVANPPGAPDPMHIFLDMGRRRKKRAAAASPELPNSPTMDATKTTPKWVQRLAMKVGSVDTLLQGKGKLEASGIGDRPDRSPIFRSICFFDPNGPSPRTRRRYRHAKDGKDARRSEMEMLEEWSKMKRAPKHAAWMHDGSMARRNDAITHPDQHDPLNATHDPARTSWPAPNDGVTDFDSELAVCGVPSHRQRRGLPRRRGNW